MSENYPRKKTADGKSWEVCQLCGGPNIGGHYADTCASCSVETDNILDALNYESEEDESN